MVYNKENLTPFLLYSKPIQFNEYITLYPVTMEHIIEFQIFSRAFTFRKDSRFGDRAIIKMTYLEFLYYAALHPELDKIFPDTPDLSRFFAYTIRLLNLACCGQEIAFNDETGGICIQGYEINSEEFDNIRRIVLLQNGIDFDIDEFLNYETEQRLAKAQRDMSKGGETSTIEDRIDSFCVALHMTEDEVKNMSIRKFQRMIERFQSHENYTILKTGECSGMVKMKKPIKYWMRTLEQEDKYAHLKADENELRSKMG